MPNDSGDLLQELQEIGNYQSSLGFEVVGGTSTAGVDKRWAQMHVKHSDIVLVCACG